MISSRAMSQADSYVSAGWEMIFSVAQVEYTQDFTGEKFETGNVMRWSPVFNYQGFINFDFTDFAGLFIGAGFRNVGFIYEIPETNIKKKFRTYNVGFPAGIKLGNMKGFFFFGGYEIEFPVSYKEKTFKNEVKEDVFSVWFSERVEPVQHTVMAGINMPYGFTVKLKYYLTNFHNQEYQAIGDFGLVTRPYENLKSHVFYVSLSFGLFEPARKYYNPKKWGEVY